MHQRVRKVAKKLLLEINGVFNYLGNNARIYIDRSEHPFWKTYQTYPPVPYTSQRLARLCHFFNRIPVGNTKPFIIDYEHVLMLSGNSRDYVYMISATPMIERQLYSDKCKAIFVPTRGALRETSRYVNTAGLMEKVHIVRPVYPIQPDNEHDHVGPFTLLTIGNKFWGKGIPLAIETFRILRERYGRDVRMRLICGDIPPDFPLVEGIELIQVPKMSEQLRFKMYREAHVFVFPCLHDSFAVYQEAMAYGVPMVAARIYDKDEVILDGQTGFLVETPISMYNGAFGIEWKSWLQFQEIVRTKIEQGDFSQMVAELVDKIELLMTNPDLVKQMGQAAQKLQREQFSPLTRNHQVKQIYAEILGFL